MLHDGTRGDPNDVDRNKFPIFYWNWAGLELNRVSTGLQGPQGGPTLGSRALGLLHLAMHDAWFSVRGTRQPYLGKLNASVGAGSRGLSPAALAMSGAAITVLNALYRGQSRTISRVSQERIVATLDTLIREAPFDVDTLSTAYRHGQGVAGMILDRLAIRPGEPGADQGAYEPRSGRYYFSDEPTHPVRLQPLDPDHPERGDRAARIYHAPFYGQTARTFAVQYEAKLELKAPPKDADLTEKAMYEAALEEVVRLGGAPGLATTKRTPAQAIAGMYWAYDGANLIGTPPRLYNQILRVIAWDRRKADADPKKDEDSDDLVRLFALCNAAMADAGKFAWREKYRFEYWRPLSGVREHATVAAAQVNQDSWQPGEGSLGATPHADPFWRTLGAPDTNTNNLAFKPPFPAYPSGHATFGAACFQMIRRFYAAKSPPKDANGKERAVDPDGPDTIAFTFVSDELNGVSRQLYQPHDPDRPITEQPGDVRTKLVRHFPSLQHAIFENAFSRIFLGVHWRFDAFGPTMPKVPDEIPLKFPDPGGLKYDGMGPKGYGEACKMTGGIPLGLSIANQIFDSGLIPPPEAPAPADAKETTAPGAFLAIPETKITNTNLR